MCLRMCLGTCVSVIAVLGGLYPGIPPIRPSLPPLHRSRCRYKAVAEGIDTSLKIQGLLVNRNF